MQTIAFLLFLQTLSSVQQTSSNNINYLDNSPNTSPTSDGHHQLIRNSNQLHNEQHPLIDNPGQGYPLTQHLQRYAII